MRNRLRKGTPLLQHDWKTLLWTTIMISLLYYDEQCAPSKPKKRTNRLCARAGFGGSGAEITLLFKVRRCVELESSFSSEQGRRGESNRKGKAFCLEWRIVKHAWSGRSINRVRLEIRRYLFQTS